MGLFYMTKIGLFSIKGLERYLTGSYRIALIVLSEPVNIVHIETR